MQRPVRRGVGHVEQKRRLRVVAVVLVDEAAGLVADRIGVVKCGGPVLRVGMDRDQPVVTHQRCRIKVVSPATDRAVEAVEPALAWPVVVFGERCGVAAGCDVPFADRIVPVSCRTQDLGEGRGVCVEVAAVAGSLVVFDHVADSGLVWVEPGEKRGAGRAASRRVVKPGEAQPARGERIKRRGGDFTPVTTRIRIAHVVGDDDDNVRAGRGLRGMGGGCVEPSGDPCEDDAMREDGIHDAMGDTGVKDRPRGISGRLRR